VDTSTYIYERDGNLLAGINVDDEDHTHEVEAGWDPDTTLADAVGNGDAVTVDDDGEVSLTVPARGYVMYTDAA